MINCELPNLYRKKKRKKEKKADFRQSREFGLENGIRKQVLFVWEVDAKFQFMLRRLKAHRAVRWANFILVRRSQISQNTLKISSLRTGVAVLWCHAVVWCKAVLTRITDTSPARGNHTIARVSVKQPWRIWVKADMDSLRFYSSKPKQRITNRVYVI